MIFQSWKKAIDQANPAWLWDSKPRMVGSLGIERLRGINFLLFFAFFYISLCWQISGFSGFGRNMKTSESEKYLWKLVRFWKIENDCQKNDCYGLKSDPKQMLTSSTCSLACVKNWGALLAMGTQSIFPEENWFSYIRCFHPRDTHRISPFSRLERLTQVQNRKETEGGPHWLHLAGGKNHLQRKW